MPDHEEVLDGGPLPPDAVPPAWQRALWAGTGSSLSILLLQALGQGLHYP